MKMKKTVNSPEIRQAMLRLLEIWNIMNTFCEEYKEIIKDVREGIAESTDADDMGFPFSNTTYNVAEAVCKIESLLEQEIIVRDFDRLMSYAWKTLTERDRFVLDAYRRNAELGERVSRICEYYSVSKACVHIYRDVALKHLWLSLQMINEDAYRYLCDLGYQWGVLTLGSQGRQLRWLREGETDKIRTAVVATGIHVLSQITMSDVEYPYICFESTQNNDQYRLWPDCFHVRLVCSRHDRQIEKSLEDALVNCGFIFQIFRFRKRGQGSPYQVVYEFPYEKKQEDNHRIKRFCMQRMLRDSRGDFVEKMKEVEYGTAA